MDDPQFRQLLNLLGLSWEGYRKVRKGVKKRIFRHMQQVGCRTVKEYCMALEGSEELRRACERLMTVSISRFFRDHRLWDILESQVLPEIIEDKRGDIKVWSAGCGCGEEVYSLKIVWDRLQSSLEGVPGLTILATDMNPVYLDKAQAGVYSWSSLKEIPEELRSTYFEAQPKGRLYKVSPHLKKGIIWKIHNILSDPLGTDFHLIFLRNNLLTYYQNDLKVPAFLRVVNCLAPGGFLVIGTHEKLPPETVKLLSFRHPQIFQRRRHTE
jgi:chemotaxis protein methyltransferase CheR